MTTKEKFNATALPLSVTKKIKAIIGLLDEAEQPGTTNAEKRDLLRQATMQNNALVAQLEKAARPGTVSVVGSQVQDIAKIDAGITADLAAQDQPDAKHRVKIKADLTAQIAEARKSLTAIGTPSPRAKDAAHQADEEWMRAGAAGFALTIAETRQAQETFGQTGRRPSYPPKRARPAAGANVAA